MVQPLKMAYQKPEVCLIPFQTELESMAKYSLKDLATEEAEFEWED